MPVLSKPYEKRVIGAAVAIPLAIVLLLAVTLRRKSSRKPEAKASSQQLCTAAVISEYDETEVVAWLRSIGVTAETAALFSANGVDGATLLLLQEGHLKEMGVVKVGDRVKLTNALSKLHSDSAAVASVAAVSATAAVNDRSAPPAADLVASDPPSAALEVEMMQRVRLVSQFVIQNLEELFGVFANDFESIPREEQLSLIMEAEQRYTVVVEAISKLPAQHQEKLSAFAENFAQLLNEVKKAFGPQSAASQMAAKTEQQPSVETLPESQSAQAVQQLVPLLKQFHEALESPAMTSASLAQRKEIVGSIVGQVERMKLMSERLHPSHAASLSSICDRIISLGKSRLGEDDSVATPAPPPRAAVQQKPATAAAPDAATPKILSRLRTLFDTLKNTAFIDSLATLPPKEIRSIVARMRGEINEILEDTEANVKDVQQKELIKGVIENVASILSQVSMLGATKVDGATVPLTPTPQQPALPPVAPTQSTSTMTQQEYTRLQGEAEKANQVASTLKDILKVLEDPSYRSNPTPYRESLLEELTHCRDVISTLPDETKLPLTQLMGKILEVFQMSLAAAAAKATANPQPPTATTASKKTLPPPVASADDEEDNSFAPSAAFNAIKDNLESVFAVLNSDNFQKGDTQGQNRLCHRLSTILQQVNKDIETKVTDEAEKEALSQLSASLIELVGKLIASTGGSATVAPSKSPSASTVSTPSGTRGKAVGAAGNDVPVRALITPQEAISKVQAVKNILVNPQFGALEPKDQLRVASGMLKDLQDLEAKIMAACSLNAVDPTTVPNEHVVLYQQHITPIIVQMRGAVESLVIGLKKASVSGDDVAGEESDGGDFEEESAEESEGEKEDEDDFNDNPRKGLFDTVRRATELIKTGRINTVADIKECMALLQDVDKVGIESEEENIIRIEYMTAIRDLTQTMRLQNDDAKTQQGQDAEDSGDDEPSKKSEEAARPKGISTLITKMGLILEDIEYRADSFNSLSELLPYMTTVEQLLGQMDGTDPTASSWKNDAEAVEVVSETLSRLQDIQQRIASKSDDGSREPSELEVMLEQYREMLEEGFEDGSVTDRAHLAPFMEVVHQTHAVEGLTIEENQSLMKLQKAILAVNEKLVKAKAVASEELSRAQKEVPPPSSGVEELDEDEKEPEPEGDIAHTSAEASATAALPLNYNGGVLGNDTNTPVIANQTTDPMSNNSTGPMPRPQTNDNNNTEANDAEKEEENVEGKEDKVIEGNKECVNNNESVEAEHTFDKENTSEEKNVEPCAQATDISECAAVLNEENKMKRSEEESATDGHHNNEKSSEIEEDYVEKIPGSLQQDVSLLPRILERLQMDKFIDDTTLFELFVIGSIIRRLEASSVLVGTDLMALVLSVRKLFAMSIRSFMTVTSVESEDDVDVVVPSATKGKKGKNFKKNQKRKAKAASNKQQAAALANPVVDDSSAIDWLLDMMNGVRSVEGLRRGRESIRQCSKDPQSVLVDVPVCLTGMISENEAVGEGVVHYTVFSLEESGYVVDDTVAGLLLRSEDEEKVASAVSICHDPSSATTVSDAPRRLAFLIGPRGLVEEVGHESNDTSFSELSVLAEILSKRYGFEVDVLVSNDLCAEEVEDTIVDRIARCLEKGAHSPIDEVLVYLHTPTVPRVNPETGMPFPQYSINFPNADGSSISHRDIIGAINAASVSDDGHGASVRHAVVLHDTGSSLQLLSAVREKTSAPLLTVGHHLAVSLTDAARSVVNTSRSWLFDGLFTPLVCEMLTVAADDTMDIFSGAEGRDEARDCCRRVICPEDFINYPTIVFGCKRADDEGAVSSQRLPRVGRSVMRNDLSLSTLFV